MYLSYCSLCCALECLESVGIEGVEIVDARKQLTLAAAYAKDYHDTWNSIHWNSSKPATKRRVRARLNHLAFDAYTAFLAAIADINAFCDRQHEQECQNGAVFPVPAWWNDLMHSLYLAEEAFVREHGREIASKQLHLFDDV